MNLDSLEKKRQDLRQALLNHTIFSSIKDLASLRLFMEVHVFAVWDFMSLVKRLQRDLCCTTVPWTPPVDPMAARLINEIVLGEESDAYGRDRFLSHYELYLEAMQEIGASSLQVRTFVQRVECGEDVFKLLDAMNVPVGIQAFTRTTLEVAMSGRREEVLGFFFFGREEVIPQMFARLLKDWSILESSVPSLAFYLQRHIQLDHEEHGPAAERLIERWIGSDAEKRTILLTSSCQALECRIKLWDEVLSLIETMPDTMGAI